MPTPAFGSTDPFTLGVEEELFLVDPRTGAQVNAGAEVVERLDEPERGHVEGELHACQVELISNVCSTAAEAVAQLRSLRAAVLATGVGVIGSGTHPTAPEGAAEISDKERYHLIRRLLGDAVADPVGALHIHIGMPDADTAIRVFNGMRHHLPLLEALAANSPFRHGRDTGLASAREITLRAWPRSYAPRAFASFEDFETSTQALTHVAGVPDYTFHWWKMRPHPNLGTVEIRALDAQVSPTHTQALVALVHALAIHEAGAPDTLPGPSPDILDEASFRAGRAGTEATLPDAHGELKAVPELLAVTLDTLGIPAPGDLPELLAEGGGAGIQRAAQDPGSGSLEPVLETLLQRA